MLSANSSLYTGVIVTPRKYQTLLFYSNFNETYHKIRPQKDEIRYILWEYGNMNSSSQYKELIDRHAAQTATQMQENFLKEKKTAKANAYCMRSKHNNRRKKYYVNRKKGTYFCREKVRSRSKDMIIIFACLIYVVVMLVGGAL
jgi:hypothetical protein